MIEVNGLRKAYGSRVAVDDVSFVIADGFVTGVLGPNGAGKTTTLQIITGLLPSDAGAVAIDGIDVRAEPLQARARLGVLAEQSGLYNRLTVREHLVYTAQLHGAARRAADARARETLARAGLATLMERPASDLSFGERRRVALARSLVHAPRNVILDEPTNGLDVPSVRAVRGEIRRLADTGCAVVLSTHVMPEVSAVCDRVVVLSAGRVVAIGTPAELQARVNASSLEDAFVRFIGSAEGLSA